MCNSDRATPAGIRAHEDRPKAAVLIAFNEVFVRTIIRLALRREGYKVIEAACAREASRLWYEHAGEINIAIVDDELADLSGQELVSRLRRVTPTIRVLFAAREKSGEQLDCRLSPELLPKPFDLGQLSEALRQPQH